ncbi:hypothetical protein EDC30_103261 [Paucimonas lemoignei]|uniref:Uncharacterized protein n=1 Tax=Paucimonas lemoignei TaxID=29443 RepID=A0A4R3I262_PAULE|nr:hypothetical protein [Paucimonas lemoignei]TCS37969.1 hypothetical protein EDC30_103261 [Paucimonas lemoignei]
MIKLFMAWRSRLRHYMKPIPVDRKWLQEAIAFYQGTSELVSNGQYRSLH